MTGKIIGWVSLIVVILLFGVWGIVYYLLKRNSKPTYIIAHGCKIFCETNHMKTRKRDIEDEIERFIRLVNSKFEKGRMYEELRRLTIIFKSKPFKPEGNVATKAEKLNGVYVTGKRQIVVVVKKFGDLQKTAFCHELLHYIMDVIDHKSDPMHGMNDYWKLIGE